VSYAGPGPLSINRQDDAGIYPYPRWQQLQLLGNPVLQIAR